MMDIWSISQLLFFFFFFFFLIFFFFWVFVFESLFKAEAKSRPILLTVHGNI